MRALVVTLVLVLAAGGCRVTLERDPLDGAVAPHDAAGAEFVGSDWIWIGDGLEAGPVVDAGDAGLAGDALPSGDGAPLDAKGPDLP